VKKALPYIVIALALLFLGMDLHALIEGRSESKATVMVKAQAPDAVCTEYGSHAGIEVSVCTLPSTPNKETYVSVYGHGPWQVYPLRPATPVEKQTAAKASAPAPTPTPTADAGVGSGSGSGGRK
jgi:hypothetical protein